MVGEVLGYVGPERPKRRPAGRIDTRVFPLVAAHLARRYGQRQDTVMRDVVRPALDPARPRLTELLTLEDARKQ